MIRFGFLIFCIVAYLAYGWVGVYWSIPFGIILWYGMAVTAKYNIDLIVQRLREKLKKK